MFLTLDRYNCVIDAIKTESDNVENACNRIKERETDNSLVE